MDILLLAFALPVATILLAIVLQKILKCPFLVAATFFAVLLIITYAVLDSSFLVFAILYTILAYVTAVLTRLICKIIARLNLRDGCSCICENDTDNDNFARSSNCNVSNTNWYCTTRNIGRTGINQISANALENNATTCSCGNNSNRENNPVIILTNENDIINNNRKGRKGRNCSCNRNCN